jgi:hypothetical protein
MPQAPENTGDTTDQGGLEQPKSARDNVEQNQQDNTEVPPESAQPRTPDQMEQVTDKQEQTDLASVDQGRAQDTTATGKDSLQVQPAAPTTEESSAVTPDAPAARAAQEKNDSGEYATAKEANAAVYKKYGVNNILFGDTSEYDPMLDLIFTNVKSDAKIAEAKAYKKETDQSWRNEDIDLDEESTIKAGVLAQRFSRYINSLTKLRDCL